MSHYRQRLQLYFSANKYEVNDLVAKLSKKTIKYIINDLGIVIEQNRVINNGTSSTRGISGTSSTSSTSSTHDNTLYIFSDGNCKRNGKRGAMAGFSVFFSDDISSPYFKFNKTRLIISEPTNNKAELAGIKYIYDIISQNKDLFKQNKNIICTDSMYSINCIENWCKAWRKNGWKNSKGDSVKNKILIEEILDLKDSVSNDINISFKHVFSHTKEPLNKDSLEWRLWNGNNIVDTNINKLFNKYITTWNDKQHDDK